MIQEIASALFALLGALLMFVAAVGMVRMPDLFMRMQASTKAGTLGIALTMIALAIFFNNLGVTIRALLVIAFFFLTTPVAAHVIARAAYARGVPLWKDSVVDELRGDYNR